MSQKY